MRILILTSHIQHDIKLASVVTHPPLHPGVAWRRCQPHGGVDAHGLPGPLNAFAG